MDHFEFPNLNSQRSAHNVRHATNQSWARHAGCKPFATPCLGRKTHFKLKRSCNYARILQSVQVRCCIFCKNLSIRLRKGCLLLQTTASNQPKTAKKQHAACSGKPLSARLLLTLTLCSASRSAPKRRTSPSTFPSKYPLPPECTPYFLPSCLSCFFSQVYRTCVDAYLTRTLQRFAGILCFFAQADQACWFKASHASSRWVWVIMAVFHWFALLASMHTSATPDLRGWQDCAPSRWPSDV